MAQARAQYDHAIATTSEDHKTASSGSFAPPPQEGPVSTLRGASASVNPRKAGQVVAGLVLATLAVLGIVFVVVGINKNSQIDELRNNGVSVTFMVSRCVGQLGGSGSNVAGYTCEGSYEVEGQRYVKDLPGSSYYKPGDRVPAITVRSDPNLLSTPTIVGSERASASVFILPAVLLTAFVLLLLVGVFRRRRVGSNDGEPLTANG